MRTNNCDASMWKVIFNSLDNHFIHGNIHSCLCKELCTWFVFVVFCCGLVLLNFTHTVWCHHNAVNFLPNHHKIHPRMYFVGWNLDSYPASVTAMMNAISYCIGPHYNSTHHTLQGYFTSRASHALGHSNVKNVFTSLMVLTLHGDTSPDVLPSLISLYVDKPSSKCHPPITKPTCRQATRCLPFINESLCGQVTLQMSSLHYRACMWTSHQMSSLYQWVSMWRVHVSHLYYRPCSHQTSHEMTSDNHIIASFSTGLNAAYIR